MKRRRRKLLEIKIQEKEILIECLLVWRGVQFKQDCLKMLLYQVILEIIVLLEMHTLPLKREENI